MQPLDHVKLLIDRGEITEAQWGMFYLADEYLRDGSAPAGSVRMHFRGFDVTATKLGLDVGFPGIIFIEGLGKSKVYAAWAQLLSVTVERV
ncbi:hypothetical protein [Porphyrobacter sp. YT40]|uniref:hypothetical protein n=1 Tax=Porphyrobacter sp. YT40 TaxID=2547601 RepID=UPI00114299F0|nr:hypothetical protein [Porphyrobacter sp. YT40]QDH35865.1 hypothetical protein E2E27_16995 [Porphyrobacter sp. YT40]